MRSAWMLAFPTILIAGCSVTPIATHTPATSPDPGADTAPAISGLVHGGQQPLNLAHIYLLEVSTGNYGNASNFLLTSGTAQDGSNNWYVTTNTSGFFTIAAGSYACTDGDVVYLYSVQGDPQIGSGNNPAAGLMAVIGTCTGTNQFSPAPTGTVQINELTTVAAAYALAGFATSATQMSGSTAALPAMAIAAQTAANLVSIGTGAALTTTAGGNGTVPQTEINTLGNILSACVNSGSGSAACSTLFSDATIDGTPGGAQPTDTASAAINIAHNPWANVTPLWDLLPASPPFQPYFSTSTPNDWTLSIYYTGGGLAGMTNVAIDATGDAWVTNSNNESISEFSPLGAALSPSTGFTPTTPQTCLTAPNGIAIDQNGVVWVGNQGGTTICEYNPSTGFANTTGFSDATNGPNNPWGMAVDASGNVWMANFGNNSVSEYVPGTSTFTKITGGGINNPFAVAIDTTANHGIWVANHGSTVLSEIIGTTPQGSGFSGAGLDQSFNLALDSSNDIWVVNEGAPVLSEFTSSGGTPAGEPAGGYAGGGNDVPWGMAVDGTSRIWFANHTGNTLSEFNNSGTAIAPSGYTGTLNNGTGALASPEGIAIDSSGNIWVADTSDNVILEFIGLGSPVVTPLSTAVKNGKLGSRP